MKVRLNRNQPNQAQKKVLKEECRREFHNLLENYNKQVALQVMHILHFDYGFGEKRLRQFFLKLKDMQNDLVARYEVGDDDVPDICRIQLRDDGIDLDKLFMEG